MKLTRIRETLVIVTLFSVIQACTYDNVAEKYGVIECDSDGVTYQNDIEPIIDVNCLACHNTGGQLPDLSTIDGMRNNEAIILEVINKPLGDPDLMPPPPNGPMSDCNIEKIEKWYETGTPE